MDTLSEQALLSGARAFRQAELTEIYQQFSPGLYRYALRLLGDECLAEDCVAETFSRFLKALRGGHGPQDHLQAYLYRIAHIWITDCYRRQPPPPLELSETLREADSSQPENQSEQDSLQAQVRLGLRSLTADQRQVVMLRFIEDWASDEVAAALSKPPTAVRALQFRALNALRKFLLRGEMEGTYEHQA